MKKYRITKNKQEVLGNIAVRTFPILSTANYLCMLFLLVTNPDCITEILKISTWQATTHCLQVDKFGENTDPVIVNQTIHNDTNYFRS